MRKKIERIGFFIGWFAIITQLILIIQNRQADITETIIRFFSFFTILTNIIVALFFTYRILSPSVRQFKVFNKKGALTAITTFILIVGLVYQFVLRGIWEPKGMQFIVDELLHTAIPLLMLFYWILYSTENKSGIRDLVIWLLYPLFYLFFVLLRGSFSNYYPYPFLNIQEIGIEKVLLNSFLVLFLILLIFCILINIKKRTTNYHT